MIVSLHQCKFPPPQSKLAFKYYLNVLLLNLQLQKEQQSLPFCFVSRVVHEHSPGVFSVFKLSGENLMRCQTSQLTNQMVFFVDVQQTAVSFM